MGYSFSYPALITLDDFIDLGTMPKVDVLAVENASPGKVLRLFQLNQETAYSILSKRYTIPPPAFGALVKLLIDVTVPDVYQARGWDPGHDERAKDYRNLAEMAWARLKEAADGKDGLFELMLTKTNPGVSAVTQGAPLMYAEQNPYSWQDAQANAATQQQWSYGDVGNPFGLTPSGGGGLPGSGGP